MNGMRGTERFISPPWGSNYLGPVPRVPQKNFSFLATGLLNMTFPFGVSASRPGCAARLEQGPGGGTSVQVTENYESSKGPISLKDAVLGRKLPLPMAHKP